MSTRLVALSAAASLFASTAFAEANKVNVHIEPAVGSGLNRAVFVTGANLKVDLAVISIGPLAPSAEVFGIGTSDVSYLPVGSLFGGGVGLRWRILNDEKGYRFVRGGPDGNWLGNLWLDAHVIITNGGPRPGFDVGLGYEFSVVDGLQIGPHVNFRLAGGDQMLMGGLSFSVGGPSEAVTEPDPDGDGIKGAADKCPNDPEDKDGFEDDDGCPDPDNDHDGVLDAADHCPNVAGPVENHGCPYGDADQDGIPDNVDKCPNEAETFNGVDDEDGCPEKEATVYVTKEKIVILEQVNFDSGEATIKPESNGLLDKVAEVMKKFPNVKRIRVEGHTDDVGEPAFNLGLSQHRAEAVREALLARGIDATRLEAQGYGETHPLEKSTTDEARAKNRRVEFVIVDQT